MHMTKIHDKIVQISSTEADMSTSVIHNMNNMNENCDNCSRYVSTSVIHNMNKMYAYD